MFNQFLRKITPKTSFDQNTHAKTTGSVSSTLQIPKNNPNRIEIIEKEAIRQLSRLINKPHATRAQIINHRQEETGNTILMLAAESNCLMGVEWLSYQPEFLLLTDQKNRFHQTALFLALFNNHIYMANILRAPGKTDEPIINYRHPKSNNTFLIEAAKKEMLTVKKLTCLLKIIPDLWQTVNETNKLGHTALYSCIIKGNWPVALFLLKNGASYTSLLQFTSAVGVLSVATRHGSLEALEYLLAIPEFKNLLNTPNVKNITIILLASLAGHWKIVEYLQALGANTAPIIDFRQKETQNDILMLIAEKGSIQDLFVLFKIPGWKSLTGRVNVFNQTALLIACLHGNQPVGDELIKKGIGDLQKEVIAFRYNGHYTSLMQAIENRSTKGVHYLLSFLQKEIDHENQLGETALIQAASQKKNTKLSIIQALVKAGASVIKLLSFCAASNQRDESTILGTLTKYGKTDVVAFLLMQLESCDLKSDQSCQACHEINLTEQLKNALLIAALDGHLELVELLRLKVNKHLKHLDAQSSSFNPDTDLSARILLDYRDEQDEHLLSKVAAQGWCNFFDYLLDTFPGCAQLISKPDNNGWTPLFYAYINGRKGMAKLLLSHHTRLIKEQMDKKAVTEEIITKKITEIITKEVIDYRHPNSGNTILMECAEKGYLFGLELLLSVPDIKTKINFKNLTSQTALCIAIIRREPNLVKALIHHGSNFEVPIHDNIEQNTLEYLQTLPTQAALGLKQDHAKTIEILTATFELTAMAQGESHKRSLSALLQRGASVHQTDKDGRTPLHLSVKNNLNTLVEALLKQGADPLLPDGFGFNAIDYSLQKNNPIALCEIYFSMIYQNILRRKVAKAIENIEEVKKATSNIIDNITDITAIAHKAPDKNTKSYIFLNVGIALKSPSLLKIVKQKLSYDCLTKVPENSNFYEAAQYELAKLFYSSELSLDGIHFLKNALKHSLRSGFSTNAIILRKHIIGITLGKTFADKCFDLLDNQDQQDFVQTYNSLINELINAKPQEKHPPSITKIDFDLLKTPNLENILFISRQCANLEAIVHQLRKESNDSSTQSGKAESKNFISHQLNGTRAMLPS